MKNANMIGKYVTASQVKLTFTKDYPDGLHEPRQGVLMRNNGDGTITLKGEMGTYHCLDTNIDVVPDYNLNRKRTWLFVLKQRRIAEQQKEKESEKSN